MYLVGAGPGDPDLVTRKGLRLIRSCDVLLHDALVAPELVAEAPESALVISRAEMQQEEINGALTRLGATGLEVVRLKGGDPFVFGRGGEEALALAEAGVPFEVVPGVTSIAAVPAAAGIPVTHRGVADTVVLSTGHRADGTGPDASALVTTGGTIVLFMALAHLAETCDGLVRAGLDPSTPAAVVSNGTLGTQKVVTAPVRELAAAVEGLPTPALVVIGNVVEVGRTIAAAQTASEPPAVAAGAAA